MNKKYSLHKICFFYTDQNYVPSTLDNSIGFYETYDEAEKERRKLDIQSLKMMIYINSSDCFEELSSFYEHNYEETQAKVVDYAQSQNWHEYITKKAYGGSETDFYWSLSLPENATDEQLATILNISDASFHKIIEYKDVKEHTSVRFNKDFWEKGVLKKLESERILEEINLYMIELELEEYFLINQQTGNIAFREHTEAAKASVNILLKALREFPDNNFFRKTSLTEWSDASNLLMAFLGNCISIKLKSKVVKEEEGNQADRYYQVEFPDHENTDVDEMIGLIELLKVKPFEIINKVTEINGEKIDDPGPDLITF